MKYTILPTGMTIHHSDILISLVQCHGIFDTTRESILHMLYILSAKCQTKSIRNFGGHGGTNILFLDLEKYVKKFLAKIRHRSATTLRRFELVKLISQKTRAARGPPRSMIYRSSKNL
jgi:hypothetical protein